MQFKRVMLLAAVLLLTLGACKKNKGKHIPDVSNIDVEVKIKRFDQVLFSIDTNKVAEGLAMLRDSFPSFTEFFMLAGPIDQRQQDSIAALRGFLTNKEVRHIYDTCQQVHGDLKGLEQELTQAMKYYKYYFPQASIPDFHAYISMFSYAAPLGADFEGIGLDFFLGEDCPIYPTIPNLGYMYIRRTLNQKHMASTLVEMLADDLAGPPMGPRMLDQMIREGKKYYFLDLFMPQTPDSIRFKMTGAQVEYLESSEEGLYKFLMDQNLLFSTKSSDFMKFVNPGPFDQTDPVAKPGNSGAWLGYKMVQEYMAKTPNATPAELLKIADPQVILKKYRPG
jgi:hypothetical protein